MGVHLGKFAQCHLFWIVQVKKSNQEKQTGKRMESDLYLSKLTKVEMFSPMASNLCGLFLVFLDRIL